MARADVRTDYRVTFVVLCAGVSAYSLLQSLVNPVLPTLQRAMHTDQRTVTWLLTAYLLSSAVCTPVLGRVGDKHGKERVLVLTMVGLSVGSLVAALAPNIGTLIVARAVQGVGGGLLPLTFGIIRDEFPRERVAGAIGVASALLAVGGGLGLVLAGPIVDGLGYRWLFWLPLIMTALTALATHLLVPESPVRSPGRIDLVAALLLSVSEGATWGWTSGRVLGLLAAAALLAVGWVRTELRSDAPLIDMRMMRLPAVWTTNLVSFLFGVAMYSVFAFVPQFLQTPESAGYGFGASVTESGLLLLPQTASMFFIGLVSGRLAARLGSKNVLVLGALMATLALLGLGTLHDSKWEIVGSSVLMGLSFGLSFAAMANLVVEAVPPAQTGVASGMNANIRTVGGSLGGALLAAIVTSDLQPSGFPTEHGYSAGFLALGAVSLLAMLVGLAIKAPDHEDLDLPGEVRHAEAAIVPSAPIVSDER